MYLEGAPGVFADGLNAVCAESGVKDGSKLSGEEREESSLHLLDAADILLLGRNRKAPFGRC